MTANSLRGFFWDIHFDNFDPQSYPHYTIARLLEFGDVKAISWTEVTESFRHEVPKMLEIIG